MTIGLTLLACTGLLALTTNQESRGPSAFVLQAGPAAHSPVARSRRTLDFSTPAPSMEPCAGIADDVRCSLAPTLPMSASTPPPQEPAPTPSVDLLLSTDSDSFCTRQPPVFLIELTCRDLAPGTASVTLALLLEDDVGYPIARVPLPEVALHRTPTCRAVDLKGLVSQLDHWPCASLVRIRSEARQHSRPGALVLALSNEIPLPLLRHPHASCGPACVPGRTRPSSGERRSTRRVMNAPIPRARAHCRERQFLLGPKGGGAFP